jgi:four helix bundle protein
MLRIYRDALELVRAMAPIVGKISRADSDLGRQLRRAMSSVVLNTAEGSAQRGARKQLHYSIALGSARESWAAIETAAAWGYTVEPSQALAERFDSLRAVLYRLAHSRN